MPLSTHAEEMTWEAVLPVWWAFFWRAFVYGALLGMVLGFVGGVIVGVAGQPQLGAAVGALLGWVGGIVMSLVVMRIALRKRYGGKALRFVSEPVD